MKKSLSKKEWEKREKWTNSLPTYTASPRLNRILMEEEGKPPVGSTDGKTTNEFLDSLLE